MKREEEFQRFLNFSVKQKYNSEERIVGWDSWLAAKHDAKPVVEIQYKRHSDGKEVWIIDDPFNSGIDEKFDSKEKAEAFAIRYGYRLE